MKGMRDDAEEGDCEERRATGRVVSPGIKIKYLLL